MSRQRRESRIRQLSDENAQLRAKLLAAHDLLHNNKLNDLHDLLHCDSCDEAEAVLNGSNISIATGDSLARFATAFNRQCTEYRMLASWTALVPSATKPGWTSIQMGGCVEVINWLRAEMGLAPTRAVGDHEESEARA